jgi:hypothetical protein
MAKAGLLEAPISRRWKFTSTGKTSETGAGSAAREEYSGSATFGAGSDAQ